MRTKQKRYPFGIGLEVDDVGMEPDMGLLALNPGKRDWRASAYDRVMPHGDAEMEDGDKSRMFRQGLLHLGAGLLSNGGGFGNALGKSISGGLLAMNKGADDLADRQYKQQMVQHQMGAPTEFRAKDMLARAAGYQPGTAEYEHFMRVQGGIEAKQSSAAISYEKVVGEDGIERMVALDPRRVGAQVVGDGASYGSGVIPTTPVSAPQPGIVPQSGNPFDSLHASVPGLRVTSRTRTPAENAALPNSVPNSFHLTGQAIDIGRPSPEQLQGINAWAAQNGHEVIRNYKDGHVHLEPRGRPRATTASGVNPFAGRPKEVEAGRVQAAQEAVTLSNLPLRGQIEAQNAGMSEAAKEAARMDAYRQSTQDVVGRESAVTAAKASSTSQAEVAAVQAKRQRDAGDVLSLLTQAEALIPRSTGSTAGALADKAAGVVGKATSGGNAIASLKAIAGQLTSKMPRMEGPQGVLDVELYKQMAGDLANPMTPRAQRLAALKTIRLLNEKYASGRKPAASAAPRRMKFNPATGRIE